MSRKEDWSPIGDYWEDEERRLDTWPEALIDVYLKICYIGYNAQFVRDQGVDIPEKGKVETKPEAKKKK